MEPLFSIGHSNQSLEYKVQDGTDAQVGDLVRMDLSEPRPEPHQPENWLVGRRQWQLVARPAARDLTLSRLRSHLVTAPDLLGSKFDRVPFSSFRAKPAEASLALVVPPRSSTI